MGRIDVYLRSIERFGAAGALRGEGESPLAGLAIERGQYDVASPVRTASGSAVLDQLTAAARGARATDLFIAAGVPAWIKVDGKLTATTISVDGEQLSRELGIVAPPEARSQWTERGSAVFVFDDGAGRVRVTLSRDQRGPGAAMRFLW